MLPHCITLHLEELSHSPVELSEFITILDKYLMDSEHRDSWVRYFKEHNRYFRAS
jgi:hypothetical protein